MGEFEHMAGVQEMGGALPGTVLKHFVGEDCALEELKMVGWDRHPVAMKSLGGHVHREAFEVCRISKGAVDWWVGREENDENAMVHRVNAGDVFVTRPGELYGGLDWVVHVCEL